MRMTVADLMCETPVTIESTGSCNQALDMFFEFETPELYVVDLSGRFLGVLPDYELIRAQLSGEAKDTCVEKLMSRMIPALSPDSDASEVARMFRDSSCSRVPVVKSGRLIGVVTRADILRVMAVLRRIDVPVGKSSDAAKRPKLLGSSRTSGSRSSRAKTIGRIPGTTESRPKVASRRKVASSNR